MIKKIIAAILLIVLFTVAIVQAMDKQANKEDSPGVVDSQNKTGIAVGVKAPNFELPTLDGKKVKLSDLKGKKVILNFWATWCPPCKAEMPDLQKYFTEKEDDVILLAVNLDPQADVQGFIDEKGITFPILLDTEDKVNALYQVVSIPTTYFIDTEGIIREKHIGLMNYEQVTGYVANLN